MDSAQVDFLQTPECLVEAAAGLIKAFRAKNPEYESKKVLFPSILRAWEQENGSLVELPSFTHIKHSYLIPIDEASNEPFIMLAKPEGFNTLTPMVPNPSLCPRAALPYMAAIPGLKELVKEEVANCSTVKHDSTDLLFSIDTVGGDAASDADGLRNALSQGLRQTSPESETSGSERQTKNSADFPSGVKKDKASIKNFLSSHAGRPLNGCVKSTGNGMMIRGYDDIQTTHKKIYERDSATVDRCDREVALVRELVEDKSLEARNMSDTVRMKRKRKEAKENVKEEWYGMRRVNITPEDRAEMKAIDLRGYVDGLNTYRGGKRGFELSSAQSGFFQYGVVRDGGLEKAVGENISVVAESDKRKKAKSLLKSLLVK